MLVALSAGVVTLGGIFDYLGSLLIPNVVLGLELQDIGYSIL